MTDANFKSLADLRRPAKLAALFGGTSGLVKGQTTVISGEPALQLLDTGDSGSLDVSDSATPKLLRLDAGRNQQLDFTAYGMSATVTVPPASQTLSGAKYGF